MTHLTHPATGHQINVDEESTDFWKAAGFQPVEPKSTPKKASPARAASKKSSK